jgi:hypothetical protein
MGAHTRSVHTTRFLEPDRPAHRDMEAGELFNRFHQQCYWLAMRTQTSVVPARRSPQLGESSTAYHTNTGQPKAFIVGLLCASAYVVRLRQVQPVHCLEVAAWPAPA